jgi:hypothetical protein
MLVLLVTSTLLACGGSSTRTLSRGSGGAGDDFAGRAGMTNLAAGAAAVETGGAGHGGSGGAKSGGSAGVLAHAGTNGEPAGADAGGRGGATGAGGEHVVVGGSGGERGGAAGAGAMAGALEGGGFTAQGGMVGTGGSERGGYGGRGGRGALGGRGPGGANGVGGAGGLANCAQSVAAYCGVAGGSGTSSCPLDWSQASNLSSLCAQYRRVTVFDCPDGQAIVVSGIDTSTTYYFAPQTHQLVQIDGAGIRGQVCVAGPTPPLDLTLPTCTPSMPCTAGAGGQGN